MRRTAITLLLLLLSSLCSCVTPVIPLPPPAPERFTLTVPPETNDRVILAGPASPQHRGFFIFILNQRTGRGTVTQTSTVDGSFTSDPLEARDRDVLEVWAARDAEDTPSDVTCAELDFAAGQLHRRSCF